MAIIQTTKKEKNALAILHKPNELMCRTFTSNNKTEITTSAMESKTLNVLLYEFQINKDKIIKSGKEYSEIKIEDFCNYTNIQKDKNGKYPITRISKEFQKLLSYSISLEYANGCKAFNILEELQYDKNKKSVIFTFNHYIVKSLKNNLVKLSDIALAEDNDVDLKLIGLKENGNYTNINMDICKISNKETSMILFYEMIKRHINYLLKFKNAQIEIEIEEFKQLLGIVGYKENGRDLENKVIKVLVDKLLTDFEIPIQYYLERGARNKILEVVFYVEESQKPVLYKLLEKEKTTNLKDVEVASIKKVETVKKARDIKNPNNSKSKTPTQYRQSILDKDKKELYKYLSSCGRERELYEELISTTEYKFYKECLKINGLNFASEKAFLDGLRYWDSERIIKTLISETKELEDLL